MNPPLGFNSDALCFLLFEPVLLPVELVGSTIEGQYAQFKTAWTEQAHTKDP
ncbi:hypothetical protein HUO13_33855 [Saccharopolyspora erythraea]|uniref:hypothetical protein n=1 Tax=Saccharopolyspora erythraea TaxID=1836 RepID=UPI001BAA32B9|nr:hypothetical protein [Saccharopolyspora erythraea]QUH05098.1 hypothetical protein HUO13_33855 [Saccharopolyspora erythraea]